MRRILLAVLLAPLLAYAQRFPLHPLPKVFECRGNLHAGTYLADEAGSVIFPGRSCLKDNCPSGATLAAAVMSILRAPDAVAALDAAAQDFSCDDPAILAEQTPRGGLCRERRAFALAHLKDVGRVVPQWTKVADQGGTFTLAEATAVRMGAGATAWRQAPFPAGTFDCKVGMSPFWDDPAPGLPKQCEALTYVDFKEPDCTPLPAVYRVKPNPGQTTRPVYPVANGARSTIAVPRERATVGDVCDTGGVTFPTVGGDVYAPYSADKARVTLCTSRP